jgi:hypothetical protein
MYIATLKGFRIPCLCNDTSENALKYSRAYKVE